MLEHVAAVLVCNSWELRTSVALTTLSSHLDQRVAKIVLEKLMKDISIYEGLRHNLLNNISSIIYAVVSYKRDKSVTYKCFAISSTFHIEFCCSFGCATILFIRFFKLSFNFKHNHNDVSRYRYFSP